MRGFRVEHVIEDIETLNQRALQMGKFAGVELLEVTAVSCHAYAFLSDRYAVLRSGASIGDKYGPIIVARKNSGIKPSTIRGKKIAVPGKLTTAFLALQLFEKQIDPVFIPFDRILDAVNSGEVDLGLVIHEGQITYNSHGLEKILDLGEWWNQEFKLPLPLGVDVIRRDLGSDMMHSFSGLFKESIEFALGHRKDALQYALKYGRGISESLGDRFVGMYVNDLTLDLGPRGEAGFQKLLNEALKAGLIPRPVQLGFIA